jgi:hypothetical protein
MTDTPAPQAVRPAAGEFAPQGAEILSPAVAELPPAWLEAVNRAWGSR